MKCKNCNCCKIGYFKSKPDVYVCIGVKEPFIIIDTNVECTEYPEYKFNVEYQNEIIAFANYLKENSCFYDIDNYHSFRAIDIDNLDNFVEEFLKSKQHE